MYALSLTQPYATLIGIGQKKIETRSWSTSFRGTIAIHASKGFPRWAKYACYQPPFFGALKAHGLIAHQRYPEHLPDLQLPLGAIMALAELYNVQQIPASFTLDAQERAFGDYTEGRYAWLFRNVRPLKEAVPCKGALNLWTVPTDVENQINIQLGGILIDAALAARPKYFGE